MCDASANHPAYNVSQQSESDKKLDRRKKFQNRQFIVQSFINMLKKGRIKTIKETNMPMKADTAIFTKYACIDNC